MHIKIKIILLLAGAIFLFKTGAVYSYPAGNVDNLRAEVGLKQERALPVLLKTFFSLTEKLNVSHAVAYLRSIKKEAVKALVFDPDSAEFYTMPSKDIEIEEALRSELLPYDVYRLSNGRRLAGYEDMEYVLVPRSARVFMQPIAEVAEKTGLGRGEISVFENINTAKIDHAKVLKRLKDKKDGKVILVTAISPTKAGEGKTTTSIGLVEGLCRLGAKALGSLREPSLGPVYGIKGGAVGAGEASIEPAEDINFQFTGDFSAVESAHNLLSDMLDNHLYFGNQLKIDMKTIKWPRTMDMNERALKEITLQMRRKKGDIVREGEFVITAASEVMAILALAKDEQDLEKRLGRIIVAYNEGGLPVTARDLKAEGAMAHRLKHALKPNLVQTREGDPVLVHAGPFANIAHGNSSVIALRTALKLGDYVVTEGGFGADLGAEKAYDIVMRQEGIKPALAVLVVTARALKMHGGMSEEDAVKKGDDQDALRALEKGFANLDRHVRNLQGFGIPVLIAINHFPDDTNAELELIKNHAEGLGVKAELSEGVIRGGEGAARLAKTALDLIDSAQSDFKPLYDLKLPLREKLETLARYYGADGIELEGTAEADIAKLEELEGLGALGKLGLSIYNMPINMAKTQYSFTHDPQILGAPTGWKLKIREVTISAGAGFIVAKTGDMMLMPGLPKQPRAEIIRAMDKSNIMQANEVLSNL